MGNLYRCDPTLYSTVQPSANTGPSDAAQDVITNEPMKEKPRCHRTWFLRRRAKFGTTNDETIDPAEDSGKTAKAKKIVKKHRDWYYSFFGPLHRLKADKQRARKWARLVDTCALVILTTGYCVGIYLIFELNLSGSGPSNFVS